MEFNKTFLYKVFNQIYLAWGKLNLYSLILAIPMIMFVLAVGVFISIIIDVFMAWRVIFEDE